MRPSLGMRAYLALGRHRLELGTAERPLRPMGELVWAHAPVPEAVMPLLRLAERLIAQRVRLSVLISAPLAIPRPAELPPGVLWDGLGPDSLPLAEAFLDHWTPDLCLWSEGYLEPALVACAARRDVPLYLIDATGAVLAPDAPVWLPGLAQAVLAPFAAVMARTANAAQVLRRAGVALSDISVTGPMQHGASALPCNETEHANLTTALAGRHLWLAAFAEPDEIGIITRAQRLASRTAHRLLLVLIPAQQAQGPDLARRLDHEGWRVCHWSEGAFPDETTQILLADSHDEMGLWYRLSPIALMASSLGADHAGCDPYPAAALGSAILSGPHVAAHRDSYDRLSAAGGARTVQDADGLAAAVIRLIAPDQAAHMAHAAWEVVSHGAEVTDRVIDLVLDTLDLGAVG